MANLDTPEEKAPEPQGSGDEVVDTITSYLGQEGISGDLNDPSNALAIFSAVKDAFYMHRRLKLQGQSLHYTSPIPMIMITVNGVPYVVGNDGSGDLNMGKMQRAPTGG